MLGRTAVAGLGAAVLLGAGGAGAMAFDDGPIPVDMRKPEDDVAIELVDDDGDGDGGDPKDQMTNTNTRTRGTSTGSPNTATNSATTSGTGTSTGSPNTATNSDTTSRGRAAGGVRVSPNQLLINQRISQAAVRRSNDALAKIASLTAQVAALQVQAGAGPIWGVSNGGNQESLVTGRGGSGITSIYSNQAGRYTVKFDRNIAACSYSATIAADDQTKLTAGRDIRVALDLGDAARTQLTVFTSRANGNSVNSPFHIQVFC